MDSINDYKTKIPEIDCIYSVGGGTILDLGKALAYKKCPLVNVPTALTNDGLASAVSSIQTDKGRVSMQMKYPNVLLCDYPTLKAAPNINAGIGDIIAKYSSAEDWKLADLRHKEVYYSKTFYLMLNLSAQSVMGGIKTMGKDCLKNEQYIDLLLGSMILSAAAMSNTKGKTYPASGSEHSLSHAVDMLYPDRKVQALHGEQCGMFTILTAYLQKNKWKKVRTVLEKINAPISLDNIGIESNQMRKIFENADRPDRYTILNEKNMGQKLKAARKTGII
jgi:glycerol-1-phosphate dehydrogenase [NAD(P)+]